MLTNPNRLKTALLVAIIFACAVGSASAAVTYNVTDVEMPGATTAYLSVPGVNNFSGEVYLGQTNFTATPSSGGPVQTLSAFCIDVFHEITLGVQNPALQYQVQPWVNDFGGHFVTKVTEEKIDGLAHQFLNTTPFYEQAAQAAIWEMEVSGLTVTTGNLALQTQIAYDVGHAPIYQFLGNYGNALTSLSDTQSFTDPSLAASVPEPGTWAMVIFGLAAAGAGLRINRRNQATKAFAGVA